MNQYKVVEKFISINGEGKRAGQLAVFIRFQGCNLNCSYCDSQYANDKEATYELLSESDILDYLAVSNVNNVTLTGGEPLLQPQIGDLIDLLLVHDYSVEIETNGSVAIKPFIKDKRPLFTLDYKVPSSLMEKQMNLDNYQYLSNQDVVKFVVGSNDDLAKALEIIKQYQLDTRVNVYFSPIFNQIQPSSIVDFMIEHNLNNVSLQLQLHKFIWDPNKRGV